MQVWWKFVLSPAETPFLNLGKQSKLHQRGGSTIAVEAEIDQKDRTNGKDYYGEVDDLMLW